MDIEALNNEFAIENHISFSNGPGNLPIATISNPHAEATISLQGAHVTSFTPKGHEPILWVSDNALFENEKAIRGGIPLCWPWFAYETENSDKKPSHGFIRNVMWNVLGTSIVGDKTQLKLGLSDTPETHSMFPSTFDLIVNITVGEALKVELKSCNNSDQPFTYSGALHSYLAISDINKIKITGLEDVSFIDKTDSDKKKKQNGPIAIDSETDRIYDKPNAECIIEDPGMNRKIVITNKGASSAVVWNPWQDRAKEITDFGDEEYTNMVCVEAAIAGGNTAQVNPFGMHSLRTYIYAEPLD